MRRLTVAGVLGGLLLLGCGGSDGAADADTELRMPSESMLPTYALGDLLQVDLQPELVGAEDVVIFYPPAGEPSTCGVERSSDQPCPEGTPERSDTRFVKRIVGRPGDRLKVIEGSVYINGKRQDEPFARLDPECATCNLPEEITIPPGEVFLMGDNRGSRPTAASGAPYPRDGSLARWSG